MLQVSFLSANTLTQTQLDSWIAEARKFIPQGRVPDYIPLLSDVEPNWLAVQLRFCDRSVRVGGDGEQPFVLMSVIKPFVLLCLLEHFGRETVFSWVGTRPSDEPFYSLMQLTLDRGFPRNPMINSGAIALASHLPGSHASERCANLCQWLNQLSGAQLFLDQQMLASVRSISNETNWAIADILAKSGHIDSAALAMDTYNQICCLAGTVDDLARLGLLLADPQLISPFHQQMVNALMLTCGLYEASGPLAVQIGLPIKSGVSGALLAVIPRQGAIACYSPALDTTGNSIAGLFLLEQLAQNLDLNIFG
jgi:glutaminase